MVSPVCWQWWYQSLAMSHWYQKKKLFILTHWALGTVALISKVYFPNPFIQSSNGLVPSYLCHHMMSLGRPQWINLVVFCITDFTAAMECRPKPSTSNLSDYTWFLYYCSIVTVIPLSVASWHYSYVANHGLIELSYCHCQASNLKLALISPQAWEILEWFIFYVSLLIGCNVRSRQ